MQTHLATLHIAVAPVSSPARWAAMRTSPLQRMSPGSCVDMSSYHRRPSFLPGNGPSAALVSSKQNRDSWADRPAWNEDAQYDAEDQHGADQTDQGVFNLRAHLEDQAGLRPDFGPIVQREDQRHENKRHVGERGPEGCAFLRAAQVDEYFRERGFEIS